jgi:hypothetical protein
MSKDVLCRLEPYEGKLSSTVLRGASSLVTDLWAGNGPRLLDHVRRSLGAMSFPKFHKKKTYVLIRRKSYGIEDIWSKFV